jgi:hypothetical protein
MPRAASRRIGRLVLVRRATFRCSFEALAVGDRGIEMLSKVRGRLTYANVMATIAVFVALGGTSVAAVSLKRNSVGTSQIKNSSVTSADVKNNSLSGSDINSLTSKDFKGGQLPQGPQGAPGPQGPTGPAGATNVVIRTGTHTIGAGVTGGAGARADCQAGERAVGGGAELSEGYSGDRLVGSRPFTGAGGTPNAWYAVYIVGAHPARTLTTYALCVSP